ncbi:MAG TPA: hypothetical protein VF269_07585 [Rhodanobacteraceae bacterium]
MAAWYPWIELIHLSCAIIFVGAVVFEVIILESLHHEFEVATMQRIEAAVMKRARRFMPFVVALLFLSGFYLFDYHCNDFQCVGTTFGDLLLAKVFLAFGVLAVFVSVMWAGIHGRMNMCRFRYTHRIVLGLMIGIVFLAKAMFFL